MTIPRPPRSWLRTKRPIARCLFAAKVILGTATLLASLSISNCESVEQISIDRLDYQNVGVSFQIPDRVQKFLQQHPSEVFWIGSTEPVFLSWEAVATFHDNDGTHRIGACNDENVDSGDGKFDGKQVVTPPWRTFADAKFLACNPQSLTWNETNGFHPCQEVSAPCDNTPHPNFPYCAQACAQHPSTDTEFVVSTTSLPAFSLEFIPSFVVVANVENFIDQTTYEADRSDPTRNRLAFVWSVPTLFDGRQAENFSPNLSISRVRAFVPASRDDVAGTRHYLNLV